MVVGLNHELFVKESHFGLIYILLCKLAGQLQ
jgi:hypothetical protein